VPCGQTHYDKLLLYADKFRPIGAQSPLPAAIAESDKLGENSALRQFGDTRQDGSGNATPGNNPMNYTVLNRLGAITGTRGFFCH
jgi:hypothetical protein